MRNLLKKGFTLIELLIVMAVVSILIAIIIPSYRGMQQDAWLAKAEKELQTLQAAVESYYRHNGSYPADLSALVNNASPRIITKLLEDPWKTQEVDGKMTYGYINGGNQANFGDYYIIYSKSIDSVDDTAALTPSGTPPKLITKGDDIVLSNLPVEKAAQ